MATAASLLFAFLPYHFWRGTFHLNLVAYHSIPLATLLALTLAGPIPSGFVETSREDYDWRGPAAKRRLRSQPA